MSKLLTVLATLALVIGVAGCGGSGENPCEHPNSVKCEEAKRSEEEKHLHSEIEEFKNRGQENVEAKEREE